jgi:hypothetical protein
VERESVNRRVGEKEFYHRGHRVHRVGFSEEEEEEEEEEKEKKDNAPFGAQGKGAQSSMRGAEVGWTGLKTGHYKGIQANTASGRAGRASWDDGSDSG